MRTHGAHRKLLALAGALLLADPVAAQSRSRAEQEVRALERAWLDAYEQADTLAMDRIVGEDFLITFPDGSTQSKAQLMAMIRSQRRRGAASTLRFRTESVTSRAYGATVVLRGIVVTASTRNGVPAEERSRYTDTSVPRAGRWQVVASHLSNPPAPAPPDSAVRPAAPRDTTSKPRRRPRMRIGRAPGGAGRRS